MTRMQSIGTHRTTVRTNAKGVTAVTYHRTDVVRFDRDSVILDSGGYRTYTTKARMVQAANQFNLGFHVYQENWNWFVVQNGDWDNPIPFVDGMVLTR